MKEKPCVLVFAAAFLPGFKAGGPIRSVANLIRRTQHSFRYAVVTRDRDLGDAVPYSDVRIGEWNEVEGF